MTDSKQTLFAPAQTKRASEVIYEQIYQKILSGELQEGDRLPSERELAEQFHRGRQSVREALRMLQQDGFLHISLGNSGGAFVQRMTLDSAAEPMMKLIHTGVISSRELTDYRYFNDRACAALAIKYCTEEDRRALRQCLEDFKAAIGDRKRFVQYDLLFHHTLALATHNQFCVLLSDSIGELASKYWSRAASLSDAEIRKLHERAYILHENIYYALLSGEVEALNEAMEETDRILIEELNQEPIR